MVPQVYLLTQMRRERIAFERRRTLDVDVYFADLREIRVVVGKRERTHIRTELFRSRKPTARGIRSKDAHSLIRGQIKYCVIIGRGNRDAGSIYRRNLK